ncbi:Rv0361 family membrane protein [Nocardia thraciensis]
MDEAPEHAPAIDQRETTRSVIPFVAAAVVAVLVIGGIVGLALARPVENNVTDSDRIAVAVRNFATAQADSDAARRATTTCPGFDERRSPLGPDALGKQVEIAKVADTGIDGDRATAAVTSAIDGRESTSTWNLARIDGAWLVCG